MTSEIAVALLRPPFQVGANPSTSMAALMHTNPEPIAVSNSITGTTASIANAESIAFLKPSGKHESNLSSIASAGLHVSRSASPMTSPTAAPADRPVDQDREAERNSSQVAREALGASEKSPGPPNHEPSVHASPEQMQVDTHPNDTSSDPYGSADHNQNSLMNTSTVASPGPIEESLQGGDRPRPREDTDIDQDSNKAFSYPMPTGGINDPRRGLSLPTSGYNRGGPRSPSAKKHRCPYCATEFTRQHNLKSHLLTHSQEKPFVCQTCQSRFRRLHDLKRHTKLHTGERPHTCPKCGRRFARGDALARHNKGQGGCAGRRASMGSFHPEDEYVDGQHPDDGMDGVVYMEPERMDEEDERRLGLPNIRRHETDQLSRSDSSHTARQPSTYPPIAAYRSSLPLPQGTQGGSGASMAGATSQPSNHTFPPAGHSSGASIFPPSTVSDSPRALSPNTLSQHDSNAQPPHTAHSPGLGQSLPHPQPYTRTSQSSATNHVPPPIGLPPPQTGVHLPPPVINSPQTRFDPQTTAKHTPSSHSHSGSYGFTAPKVGLDGSDPAGGDIEKLWAFVHDMHKELTGLRTEVAALRAQIASSNSTAAPVPVEVNQTIPGSR
ncbi:C2H2 zinc finger protein [Penicillium brasilianum]|uniref:C2H2 zinc finger protein n=1 Tax=Penicillium brasilianum TaxID=104259 RepID=A0A1S9RZG0_PENBI|nr:C2H2 zinc finger protein [Penicillium brasilianum]